MINPSDITNYSRTDAELEEFILFCIGVAGKSSTVTAKCLETMLKMAHLNHGGTPWMNPFRALRKYGSLSLLSLVKDSEFGCYTLKSRGFEYIVNARLDLRTCTVEDLKRCPGIGGKTARFFILHSRENAQVACLDTHVLKWLVDIGYEGVPKSSPQSKSRYHEWEEVFLHESKTRGKTPADLDLEIWRAYSAN